MDIRIRNVRLTSAVLALLCMAVPVERLRGQGDRIAEAVQQIEGIAHPAPEPRHTSTLRAPQPYSPSSSGKRRGA